jgi:hypothetical protein
MPAGTYTVRVIVNGLYIPLYQYVSLSYAVLQVNIIRGKYLDNII